MPNYGTLVMGPAGAGKSTFCASLIQTLRSMKRPTYYINLDPAAETFAFEPDWDIRDLISVSDAMEELGLGPNGGLMYCFEYLSENMSSLLECIDSVTQEFLIIIDMPGQIELYTHVQIVPNFVKELTRKQDVQLCAVYLLEATFVLDKAKFFAGSLGAMSAMMLMGIPHLNVLSKMDLLKGRIGKRELKKFVQNDVEMLVDLDDGDGFEFENGEVLDANEGKKTEKGFARLNTAVARLIEEMGLVSYLKLNADDEDSVKAILSHIDHAIQYQEAQEVREEEFGELNDADG
ncbi:hypothetical protein K470DRAFT_265229 [Piedraia hortae CBS 480.64]|uniref:GPN-loop GTPase 3 n=1 Tax=Piedraia hortae CBS 480.64 TaxID=1314780 RepID=A0A6A7BWK0_9PEZI|nr:hypothetical protein K470DRAFT_265229 [Piedraia hortae CBS 480.64]